MRPDKTAQRRANGMRVHPATRWHRALGIASTLIVVVTVLTGLALNHGESLSLARRHPHNAVVDKLYRQSAAGVPQGHATSRGWVTQLGIQIYLDSRAFAEHETPLVGAVVRDDMLFIAYRDALVQYDGQGQLVESFGALDGLTVPITALGSDAKALAVDSAAGPRYFDPEQGKISAAPKEAMIGWSQAARLPRELRTTLAEVYRGSGVTYERVLLDLHSGRMFGRVGEWVVDAAALCLLTLALTGTYMFFKFKRNGQRPPR